MGNVKVRTLAKKEAHAGKAESWQMSCPGCPQPSVACGSGQMATQLEVKSKWSHTLCTTVVANHGVALALSQAASQCLQGCSPINDRIITATVCTALTPLTVIQVYAPTNCAGPDVKDNFYQQL